MHGAFLTGLREAANIANFASARSSRIKLNRTPFKNAHACASLLADLFREPNIEFGSFAVIFARNDSDSKSAAILRVALSDPQKRSQEGARPDLLHSNKLLFKQLQSHFNQQQELHVYTLLSKQQALELREVRGGDDVRLSYLDEKLGVKLGISKLKTGTLKRKLIRRAKIVSNSKLARPFNSNMVKVSEGIKAMNQAPREMIGVEGYSKT
ncbi:unnamed protein product [Linum tenue]|uniref:Uncharacterized protein n=1 Tax=Linum tenue TaxID=586396 RepID=A0AAV0JQF3_9ROSI|nr:unnamed protein product [Linum tenue]